MTELACRTSNEGGCKEGPRAHQQLVFHTRIASCKMRSAAAPWRGRFWLEMWCAYCKLVTSLASLSMEDWVTSSGVELKLMQERAFVQQEVVTMG